MTTYFSGSATSHFFAVPDYSNRRNRPLQLSTRILKQFFSCFCPYIKHKSGLCSRKALSVFWKGVFHSHSRVMTVFQNVVAKDVVFVLSGSIPVLFCTGFCQNSIKISQMGFERQITVLFCCNFRYFGKSAQSAPRIVGFRVHLPGSLWKFPSWSAAVRLYHSPLIQVLCISSYI